MWTSRITISKTHIFRHFVPLSWKHMQDLSCAPTAPWTARRIAPAQCSSGITCATTGSSMGTWFPIAMRWLTSRADIILRRTIHTLHADALKAGDDLNCGRAYNSLGEALKEGLVSEADIDRALTRLFTARFRLGMFDADGKNPYADIPVSENNTAAHRQLALNAARESIVLLKNDGTLPLRGRSTGSQWSAPTPKCWSQSRAITTERRQIPYCRSKGSKNSSAGRTKVGICAGLDFCGGRRRSDSCDRATARCLKSPIRTQRRILRSSGFQWRCAAGARRSQHRFRLEPCFARAGNSGDRIRSALVG